MQKSINDMAKYIKNIIPADIPETYTIKSMFTNISSEEKIRSGVQAFRDFIYLVCDHLIVDGSLYDKPIKETKNDVSHPSLQASYPFLNNVKSILFSIGYHGVLEENGLSILLSDLQVLTSVINADGWPVKTKISVPKIVEALKFLTCCGMNFEGIDLDEKKPDISKATSLVITYPKDNIMLTGMKIMSIAQRELCAKGNHDIFIRCDYRILKEEDTEATFVLKDLLNPFSTEVQNFILKLHQQYLNEGLTCRVDIFYLSIRFIYSYKNKEIWTVLASQDSYYILIKAQNTQKYADVIEGFPECMQEKISRGYGCNKKLFGEPCQKGCHGFSFPLDDKILDISKYIEAWIELEVKSLVNLYLK